MHSDKISLTFRGGGTTIWRKEFKTNLKEHANHLWVAIIAFLAIGTIFQQPAGFVVAGIFTAYFILNRLYNKHLGSKLILHTPAKKIKAFPDEEITLTFQLENRSIIPIFSSRFEFQTTPVLREQKYLITTGKIWNLSRVPLTLMGKRKTFIEFSVVAKHRGSSRLDKIVLDLPHLFNFDSVLLKFAPAVRGEFLVFPRLLPVNGIETIVHPVPGQSRTNFSPFEDILSTRGTRDYQYSDPFHHINWKATAKTKQLQTNIYEKVTDMSFILVVNLGEGAGAFRGKFSEDLEAFLSYTAYLSHYLTEKGHPFELFINVQKPGGVPYIHLPEGEGKDHLRSTLEVLARIQNPSILPFPHMLYSLGKQVHKPATIIIIGEMPAGSGNMMRRWKKEQKTVYHVVHTEEGAVLKRWFQEGLDYAN